MLSPVAAFAVVALVVVIMPGADTILVLRTSLREGARAGVITATGVVCGPILWGTLAGWGIAALLGQNMVLYTTISLAGGVYLAYLALRTFLSARSSWRSDTSESVQTAAAPTVRSRAAAFFLTGLMTNILNPKIGVFYIAVMPGLFLGETVTVWLGTLLGSIQAAFGLVFLSAVAAITGSAKKHVVRPRTQAVLEGACGVFLLGFGVLVIGETLVRSNIAG